MALFFLVLLATLARPGVSFEQTTQVSIEGRPPGARIVSRVWHQGRRMRLESGAPGGPAFILRLDQGRAFRLDPARKTAVQLDVDGLRQRSREDVATAAELMGAGPEASVRSVRLEGTRTIAAHLCRGYRLTAASAVLDVWVATDLPLGMEAFTDFLEWSGASESMAALMDELEQIRGFPLETRARVSILGQVQETLTTVSRVRVEPLPSALFELPSGYALTTEAPPGQEEPQ